MRHFLFLALLDSVPTRAVETRTSKWLRHMLVALASFGLVNFATAAIAEDCQQTAEGRVCKVTQPIIRGAEVDAGLQRQLGLVTVNGGCSGTLLNRFWVLTARHCVTTGGAAAPLLAPNLVNVTADWAPGQVGIASRINDFALNVATPGSADIVLFYLGTADLGDVNSQRIYAVARDMGGGSVVLSGRLTTADAVTQYGQGFSTFARGVFGGVPPAVPAGGAGVYRSAPFTPSLITATGYTLSMNNNQVGAGGDSGGPTVVTVGGVGVGIAGVQSTCSLSYVRNAPIPAGRTRPTTMWASGISACQYVSTEPFWTEIRNAIRETPGCKSPACAIPPILRQLWSKSN